MNYISHAYPHYRLCIKITRVDYQQTDSAPSARMWQKSVYTEHKKTHRKL